MKQPAERRLAAILATDVAGYSRLMGADEEGTHARLRAHLRELIDPKIAEHRGRIPPQLTQLIEAAPEGDAWLHEIKFDGYRMHARLDRGAVRLLTRTGLDWTDKYPAVAAAVALLPARQAYLDGELCGVRPDGTTSFSLIQNASDTGNSGALVFFLFDLLHLDGEAIAPMPVTERKERLRALLSGSGSPLHFSDHQIGRGQAFYDDACTLKVEGIVS